MPAPNSGSSLAQQTAGIRRAAPRANLTWIPSEEDPTLGTKQREGLRGNRIQMEREADAVGLRLLPVTTVDQARARVLETVD